MSGELKAWGIDLEKYRHLFSETEWDNLQAFFVGLRRRLK